MPLIAKYGSWKSPVSAEMIAAGATGLGQIKLDGEDIYWVESRPSEEGRSVVVCKPAGGDIRDVTPQPLNARTRVHEYGGGAFLVNRGTVYFSNFSDQRLYRQRPGSIPVPITPPGDVRYADGVFDVLRNNLVCVCEEHADYEVVNSLVRIDPGGIEKPKRLAAGHDFYSSPRISPDGSRLAWLTWDHPDMPWDSSTLWCAKFGADGSIQNEYKVAGGPGESVCQPEFSPGGDLYFVSDRVGDRVGDRSGWWNLYRWKNNRVESVYSLEAEFAEPHWAFGESHYAFESENHIICSYIQNGVCFLGSLDLAGGRMETIKTSYTWIDYLRAAPGLAVMVAGSPSQSSTVIALDLKTGKEKVLKKSSAVNLSSGYISCAREIEFPTEDGLTAHAFYYPPVNQDYTGPKDELPPLLVLSHGGPTSAATSVLNLTIQFWTSRGWAAANVNYGGSSGFGRDYRRRLNGKWGVVDVDDCVNCARYLVEKGLADPQRLAIRGGSAGGYTTLACLTFRRFFKVGASYYGVSDIEALAKDTHKFESRYMDSMVGPYPERRDLYIERSPINFVDRLSSPVIFFQGAEDKIVPPNQSEMMVDALRRKGIPVAYLLFEHEQHGFRIAANIKRSLEAEEYFYSKILGFELADRVQPVEIENLK